jgi:cytochrome c oxidase subunit III
MSTGNTSSADAPHAHHFESAEHEYVSSKLGIWLFLATEVLMFGALLVAYVLYHGIYPEVFVEGSKALSWKYGAVNTAVLLFSSFTMAISIYHLQKGNPGKARLNLLLTLVCGFVFLGIKYIEYSHKIHLGLLPGSWFHGDLKGIPNLPLYYSFYYMMTGLHGIHVCIGMALIFWVYLRTGRGDFSPKKYTAVEGVGLFWHLVDLVWIFLFPLLYLVEGANS